MTDTYVHPCVCQKWGVGFWCLGVFAILDVKGFNFPNKMRVKPKPYGRPGLPNANRPFIRVPLIKGKNHFIAPRVPVISCLLHSTGLFRFFSEAAGKKCSRALTATNFMHINDQEGTVGKNNPGLVQEHDTIVLLAAQKRDYCKVRD